MLGRIIQRKLCVIWTRRDSPVSLRFGSPCREAKALRARVGKAMTLLSSFRGSDRCHCRGNLLLHRLPQSSGLKIATPVCALVRNDEGGGCGTTRAKSRLRRLRCVHVCGRSGSLLTWRGEAALPSLVGKVAHAKRVTDELSSRFRKQLCPIEQKNHSKLGRIIQRKRCVIWTR